MTGGKIMKYRKVILVLAVVVITLASLYVGGSWAMDQVGSIHTPPDHGGSNGIEDFSPPPGHTPSVHDRPLPAHTPPDHE